MAKRASGRRIGRGARPAGRWWLGPGQRRLLLVAAVASAVAGLLVWAAVGSGGGR